MVNMRIPFTKALGDTLISLKLPIVSDYTVFLEAYKINRAGSFNDAPLYHQQTPFTRSKVLKLIGALKNINLIRHDPDFPRHIYRVNEVPDGTADEIGCLIDPFCYLSHLSAMRRYGLTERIPASVTFTTLTRPLWDQQRDEKIKKDIGEALKPSEYIPLRQSSFPESVRKMPIHRHETQFPARPTAIRDSYARISDIGSTFADMLDRPGLCGGMEHVLDVWKEHARLYIDEIITRISEHPKKIVKVRAGYILEEIIKCNDERIDSWLASAQRGSSRLLDPEKPFASHFSEKWMISLNV